MATSKKPRRSVMGADPLDMLTSPTVSPTLRTPAHIRPRGAGEDNAGGERAQKERVTVQLPADLLGEVRDAVVHLSGPPTRLTLASFVESAVRAELERLRDAHAKGKRFPHHETPLRAGRPLGS